MRRVTCIVLLLGALFLACESKTPTGPSTVTIEDGAPTTTTVPGGGGNTTTTTTTTVPGGGGTTTTTIPGGGSSTTTIPLTTTTVPSTAARQYTGAPGDPLRPVELTLVLEGRRANASLSSRLAHLPFVGSPEGSRTMASFSASGVYRTGSGSGGTVTGSLEGTLASGTFTGTLVADGPGCRAEREFSGTLTETQLQWSGGRTLRNDCKDNPLAFSTFTMVSGGATLPPTTSIPTTSTQPCTYALNPGGATIGLPGGSGNIQVTTQPGCGWSAQSVVPWVTVQPTSGASGPGVVQYTVTATGAPRQATLIIAGLPFILKQEAPPATTTTSTSTSSSPTTSTSTSTTIATSSSTSTTTTSISVMAMGAGSVSTPIGPRSTP